MSVAGFVVEMKNIKAWIRHQRNDALRIIDENIDTFSTDKKSLIYCTIMTTRKRLLNKMLFIYDKILNFDYNYTQYLPALNKMAQLHIHQIRKTGDLDAFLYESGRIKNLLRIIYDFAFRKNFQRVTLDK